MIHLHSMFSPETNTSAAGQNTRAPLSQSTLDSFHGALSDAVSSTLEKFGIHPHEVKISVTRANAAPTPPVSIGPDSPVRTAPPTPGTPASNSSPGAGSGSGGTTASGAPDGGYDPFLQAASNNPYQSAPLQSSTKSSGESGPVTLTPQQAFDNAYWVQQPAAVQPLRTMQNQEQREALATQLASEGYSIDVPIMVWGWDPATVTSMRQSEGYTWVPSALQNPVENAPGLPSLGTLSAYDPNNPPAGSIAV
jgi:hypothetical protein